MTTSWLIIIVIFIVVGLGTLIGGFIVSRRSSSLIEERLGLDEVTVATDVGSKSPMADALNSALARRGLGSNLATQLARARLATWFACSSTRTRSASSFVET